MGLQWLGNSAMAFVRNEAAKRLDAAGAAVANRARQLAPVDSGKLRDSIGYFFNASTLTLTIYVGVPYGAFQEFGSSRNPAHPYLRPALAELPRYLSVVTTTTLAFGGTGSRYSAGMAAEHGSGHARGARATFGRR
jgi:HK97 gp10 family phage protein